MQEHKINHSIKTTGVRPHPPSVQQARACELMCERWLEVCLLGSLGDTNESQRDFGPECQRALGPVTSEVPAWLAEPMGGHQREVSTSALHSKTFPSAEIHTFNCVFRCLSYNVGLNCAESLFCSSCELGHVFTLLQLFVFIC